MALLDHFHPPVGELLPWEGFNSAWATSISNQLNHGALPQGFRAIPHVKLGTRVEVDVGAFEDLSRPQPPDNGGVVSAAWAPLEPPLVGDANFTDPDIFEVRVLGSSGRLQLSAAIELVSPSNKDRPESRRAFAVKCASYLLAGVGVVVVDVVTERRAELHADLAGLLKTTCHWQSPTGLSAISYRIHTAAGAGRLEAWPAVLKLGENMPRVPLWVDANTAVPLDLEPSYRATFEWLRMGELVA